MLRRKARTLAAQSGTETTEVTAEESPFQLKREDLADRLEEAVRIARTAGEFTLEFFRSAGLAVEIKSDGSPVTEADRGAERLIRAELVKLYPEDGVFGEEEAETPGSSGLRLSLIHI